MSFVDPSTAQLAAVQTIFFNDHDEPDDDAVTEEYDGADESGSDFINLILFAIVVILIFIILALL